MGIFEIALVVVVPVMVGVWQARRDIRHQRPPGIGPLVSLAIVALIVGVTVSVATAVYAQVGAVPIKIAGVLVAGVMSTVAVTIFGSIPAYASYRLTRYFSNPKQTEPNTPLRRPDDTENPYRSSGL